MATTKSLLTPKRNLNVVDPVSVYTSRPQPAATYYDYWQLPSGISRILLYLSFAFIIIGLLINVRR